MEIKRSGMIEIMIVLLLMLSVWVGSASARSGGPDYFGYTFKDSTETSGPTYDWIEINKTGTGILPNSDDEFVENISVGFFFNFYGTDYSNVSITNNGLVLSRGGTRRYINQPIGNSTPHNFIAPFWDDIVTWSSSGDVGSMTAHKITKGKEKVNTLSISQASTQPGAIYYQTLGTAPNRMFVVEWENNQHFTGSEKGVTFEVILYEGTNNIKFQYKNVNFGRVFGATGNDLPPYDNGGSATVGIEGPGIPGDNLSGKGLQYSFNEPVIDPGLSILFKFPSIVGTNLYLSKNAPVNIEQGGTMTYTLYFNNFGKVAASSVTLEDTLPLDVEFISASDEGTYDTETNKVTWDIGTVDSFSGGTMTVNVRISEEVNTGTVIHSTASISTTTLETRYDDNVARVSTSVIAPIFLVNSNIAPTSGATPNGDKNVDWTKEEEFSFSIPDGCENLGPNDVQIQFEIFYKPDNKWVILGPFLMTKTDGKYIYKIKFFDHSIYGVARYKIIVPPAICTFFEPEQYDDANGNHIYDRPEIFIDLNNNGTRDEFEPYKDPNNNLQCDPDEKWYDRDKDGVCFPGEKFYDTPSPSTYNNSVWDGYQFYVDPAGYIYDLDTGYRIAGAKIWLQSPDENGRWDNVKTGQIPPIMDPDVNPQITGVDGQYQWDVMPGPYRVHVEAHGYYPTNSIVVNIPPPVTDLHVGLKRIPISNISGYKINDTNGNGKWDPGEVGLPGWTIKLTNSKGIMVSTLTDADGKYTFSELQADTYTVEETQKTDWILKYPPDGNYTVILSYGETITDKNFLNQLQQVPFPEFPTGIILPVIGILGCVLLLIRRGGR